MKYPPNTSSTLKPKNEDTILKTENRSDMFLRLEERR